MYRQLQIEFDQDGESGENRDWVVLSTREARGTDRALLSNRRGFSLPEIIEAACSTGWAIRRNGVSMVDSLISCGKLADCLERMFEQYFDSPTKPTQELLRIRDKVENFLDAVKVDIPMFAYAWLDMLIRDDVADVAASSDPWENDSVEIDLRTLRARRIRDLIGRYDLEHAIERNDQKPDGRKLSQSVRSRSSVEDAQAG